MAFTRVLGPGIHTASNINSHNINSTGIITAVSFVGNGAGLTGIASTDNIITGTAATFNTYPVDINAGMDVVGVSTFSEDIIVNGITVGKGASSGGGNTVLGEDAFDNAGISGQNVAIGKNAMTHNTSGSGNVAVGFEALYNNQTTHSNTGIGRDALRNNLNGTGNVAVGRAAMYNSQGDNNTALGQSSLYQVGVGKSNTTAGTLSGYNLVSGSNNIILGYNAQASATNANNEITLGNSLMDHLRVPGIGLSFSESGAFISGIVTATGADINGDLDVDGHTNLDNVSVAGVTTFASTINATTISNAGAIYLNTGSGNNVVINRGIVVGAQGISVSGGIHGSNLILSRDLDVDGHTNLDNVSIAGVTTFSGGITGTTANFSGNVTVGGVLTYEDVKNVDSVGIATARVGIKVLAGGVEIDGGGLDVVGVSTFNDDVTLTGVGGNAPNSAIWDYSDRSLNIGNSAFLKFGSTTYSSGQQLQIYQSGSIGFTIFKSLNDNQIAYQNDRLFFNNQANNTALARIESAEGVSLYYTGTKRLQTSGIGVTVTGTVVATGADINGDIDVDGHTNLDNVSIAGVSTFSNDVRFSGIATHYERLNIESNYGSATSTNVVPFQVNAYAGDTTTGICTVLFQSLYGRRPEFILNNSHNGNWNNSNGQTQHWRMLWKASRDSDTTEEIVELKPHVSVGGSVNNFGIKVTDNTNGLRIAANFSAQSQNFYANNSFCMRVDQTGIGITDSIYHYGDSTTKIRFPSSGTIRFETAGSQRLNINSSGTVSITNDLDVDGHTNLDNVSIAGFTTCGTGLLLNNSIRLRFGNSSNSYIYYDAGSGVTHHQITGGTLAFASNISNNYKFMIRGVANLQTELYYNGSEKLRTTDKGIRVGTGATIETNGQATFSGIVTATSFKLVNGSDVGTGAGGTWSTYTAGIATSKSVGVNTSTLDDNDLVGVGNSFQGLYISNGMIIHDNTLSGNHYIGTAFNGLMAGPVNIEGTLSVDGSYVVV